jgi:hypothetical protein
METKIKTIMGIVVIKATEAMEKKIIMERSLEEIIEKQ